MFKTIELEQGSDEWHAFRAAHVGASDAPVIMGVSPYSTPYQLWRDKLGLNEKTDNAAMARGRALEPHALDAFCCWIGQRYTPRVLESSSNPWMSASLDGLSECQGYAVEIKCVKREFHEMALNGQVPDCYFPQLQHQLAVTGHDFMYYWSFDGQKGACVKVEREQDYIDLMIANEQAFWESLESLTPPALSNRDYVDMSNNATTAELCAEYALLLQQHKEIEAQLKQVKQTLIDHCQQPSVCGSVRLMRSFRKGAIDYKKVPELQGVDLEPYRKRGCEVWSVRVG
jgi:putative phage-type endonuclease